MSDVERLAEKKLEERIAQFAIRPDVISIELEDFEILKNRLPTLNTFRDEEPWPPIKRRESGIQGQESVEYDHHAPDYVERMTAYRIKKEYHEKLVLEGWIPKEYYSFRGIRLEVMQ
jgi:hypothetical protein